MSGPFIYTPMRLRKVIGLVCSVMFVHTDPCIPTSCAGCALMHCPQRKARPAARVLFLPHRYNSPKVNNFKFMGRL
jgi:hypothetical protein